MLAHIIVYLPCPDISGCVWGTCDLEIAHKLQMVLDGTLLGDCKVGWEARHVKISDI